MRSGNDSVNGNWTYSYDNFNRLVGSNKNAGAQTFSYVYDRYGNRLQQNAPQGGPAPQYLFDNNNRISGSGVTYDALGNIQTDGLGNTFTYDAESRLITVVNSAGTYNYTYNAEGQRVKTNAAEYLYDLSGRAITLFDPTSGVWNFGEIYAGDRHVATYSGATTNFLHTDWLGTKRVMSNLTGTNSQTCTSLPFGDAQSCTGTEWGFNHFTDDGHDSESNLEHTWFRQLSGTQGRWMTPDPYLGSLDSGNPQSLNRYNYVFGAPTIQVDPLGLETRYFFVGDCLYSYNLFSNKAEDGEFELTGPPTLVFCAGGGSGSGAGGAGGGSGGFRFIAPNPCAKANPAALNYTNVQHKDGNTMMHIFLNHMIPTSPNGGKSVYTVNLSLGDGGISASIRSFPIIMGYNAATLNTGFLTLPITGNTATISQIIPGSFATSGGSYIGFDANNNNQPTNVNTLVVQIPGCMNVVNSYPGMPSVRP